MSVELEDRPRKIETGRSWRDLPPRPPASARSPRPPASAPVAQETRRRIGGRLGLVAAAALLGGLALGLWSPWSGDVDPVAAAAPAPSPAGAEELPDTIVPETPEGLFEPPPTVDEDPGPFGLFDGTPFADRFPGIRDDLSLIELGELPEGYRAMGSIVSQAGDLLRHQIRLLGPGGIATIRAVRQEGVTLPPGGEPIEIRGVDGRLSVGSTTSITWVVDDVLVTVEAPSEVGVGDLTAIAEAVEVVR